MVLSASICSSGTTSTSPTVSNRAVASAICSAVDRVPALRPVTAMPTTAGVFGIDRITPTEAGSRDSKVATVTPAATLTTRVPGARLSAISRSRSGTIGGLTATITMPAPVTASRLAFGSVSVAQAVTPWVCASSAALAADRLVARMPPSTMTPGLSSPARTAFAIEPAPRKAIAGRVTGVVVVMVPV
jgi:hypothetical protein